MVSKAGFNCDRNRGLNDMANINQVFCMLSWDSDEKTQQKGIREAQEIKYLSVLFQPIESKSVWENCAKVLASKSDDELKLYIFRMFQWLQDMNWPGAEIIYRRLLEMPAEMLAWRFQRSLADAIALKDNPWISCLLAFEQEYESRHQGQSLK